MHEAIRDSNVLIALAANGIRRPSPVAPTTTVNGVTRNQLDTENIRVMTALAVDAAMPMIELVKLVRGESDTDPRPNKAIRPADLRWLLRDYEHVDLLVDAATHGLRPEWSTDAVRGAPVPKNHQSAVRHMNAVIRSIRSGQDGGQYLVVDDLLLDKWSDVRVSPLGAVEKKDTDPDIEVRLIHDLSFPRGESTNTATDRRCLPNGTTAASRPSRAASTSVHDCIPITTCAS